MSVFTAGPDRDAPGPVRRGSKVAAVLVALVYAAQAFVLLFTFTMGLGWGGLTYAAAVVQAGLAFVLITRLAARKPSLVVLVPVLSAVLTGALAFAGQAHGRATACSDQERDAAQQLAAPPGTTVQFEGEYIEGCIAHSRMSLSKRAILEHYQAELARNGWQERPGRQEATVGTVAEKDGLTLTVDIVTEEEGGAQILEVVVGDSDSPTPCQINTVDGYLERTSTSEVEPGNWVVFASDTGQRGSVVVRDRSAAVVLERETHAQPEDDDDLMQIEELSGGPPTLALHEGDYEVECRPRGDAASTAPLRVAWASTESEQVNDVVLRIFETPDDRN